MSKMYIVKTIIILTVVIFILTIGGVAASWSYATHPIDDVKMIIYPHAFPWEGSEILPDGIEGENHNLLINNLLNGTMTDSRGNEVGIGLNTPNSELNQQLDERENRNKYTFGSMDAWDTDQMHSLFGLDASKLAFMIYSPPNNENLKYLYTTNGDLGDSGWFSGSPNYPLGERIYPIYRTRLEYQLNSNGEYEWVAVKTVIGSAKSQYYDNNIFGSGVVKTPAFDPLSFAPLHSSDCESGETAINMGSSASNAIYVYSGRQVILNVASDNTITYFKYAASSGGTATININQDSNKIIPKVYSNANLTNSVALNANGNIYRFSTTRNTTYYFTITGSQNLDFTLI